MDIEKELQRQLKDERESEDRRNSYDREISFYELVAAGKVDELARYTNEGKAGRMGILSSNSLTDRRYHAIIMVALISRFCIEAGMDVAVSYSLSDIFIRMLDKARTIEEIDRIKAQLAREYCKRMQGGHREKAYSRHVVLAIEYIKNHLSDNLSLEAIAGGLGLNESYLSKLFARETGKTLSHFIREEKIKVACDMLRHLEDSGTDIAGYLGYSSQSHFIQVFKKETGLTPEEYRKKHYHKSWISGKE